MRRTLIRIRKWVLKINKMANENNPIRLIWKCKNCKDVVISYSHIRHDMNYCECEKSAVDLEEGYMRGMGDIKIISRKEFVNNQWKNLKDK